MTSANFRSRSERRNANNGIILLVVLGMLTLFSVLSVSYLVFTSRQRSAAFNINRAESAKKDPQPWLDETLKQVLVGVDGPTSSLWGHDLLGDLYGQRDAVVGDLTAPSQYVANDNSLRPEVLLEGFIRVPTNLYGSATYPNKRDDHGTLVERRYPVTPLPPGPPLPPPPEVTFPTDDSLSGRIVTFTGGPLDGLSVRIIRYFGDHRNATNGRAVLTGQMVLDFRPHLDRAVTVGSTTRSLRDWISRHQLPLGNAQQSDISLLFYDQVANASTGATPLSQLYVNGRMLNGPGLGWDVERDGMLQGTSADMNLNETINVGFNPITPNPTAMQVKDGTLFENSSTGGDVPVALQGHYALYRRAAATIIPSAAAGYLQDLPSGDMDEPYDAPDEQNWWLSYFPDNTATPYLGRPAPSFVRPGLIYWLVNQQDPDPLDSLPIDRLREILRAVQRATLRPIAIESDPAMPGITNRAPGVLQLDYSTFTGGNLSPLGQPINFQETDPTILAASIRQLAQSLIGQDVDGDGRPDWDVDNNGDGIPDGVWIDAGLSLDQSDDGSLAKPMVSIMIEDLSGRVNVNVAGNLAQARGAIANSADGVIYRAGAPTTATSVENNLPSGFGYGPAEISLRPLFAHQTVTFGNGPLNLLRRRLNSRTINGVEYVGAGHLRDPITRGGNDFPGWLRQPGLVNLHDPYSTQGLPVDKFGRGSIALGINGGLMISGASVAVQNAGGVAGDLEDDPYEFDLSPGDDPDSMFTLTDLEGILRFNDFDRDALNSELVELIETHLRNVAAVPSPSDIVTVNAARQEAAHSMTTASNSVASAVGILGSEFRNDLTDSRRASSPQDLLVAGITAMSREERNALLMQLFPQELLAGGKLDLNRPFGNGNDEDGNGVADDPNELRSGIQRLYDDFTQTLPAGQTIYSTPFTDVTPGEPGPSATAVGVTPDPTPQALFARHLYVMAMSLVRDQSPGGNPGEFDFLVGAEQTNNGDVSNIAVSSPTVKRDGTTRNTVDEEYQAWRIAQWAINVADFRDTDGIMSRFDYDVDPFDGWDITDNGGTPSFRTVWGMEFPELALEESLAFHDRRVRDTNLDPSMQPRFQGNNVQDQTPDQYRIPQGSLFLELRATRSPDYLRVPTNDQDNDAQAWAVPRELYGFKDVDHGGNNYREYMLDLARRTTDGNPVWRIVVSKAHPSPAATLATDPTLSADGIIQPQGSSNRGYTQAELNRLTSTLQPERPDFFGPAIPDAVDRVVWFTNDGPGNVTGTLPIDTTPRKVFYNRYAYANYPVDQRPNNSTTLYLRGGQYAVVGPRQTTHVGSLNLQAGSAVDDRVSGPLVPYADYESPQRFLMNPGQFQQRTLQDNSATPTIEDGSGIANASIRRPLCVLAAADDNGLWSGPNTGGPILSTANNNVIRGFGLNVSEPLPGAGYYREPDFSLQPDFPVDSYYSFADQMGSFPDMPFDDHRNAAYNSELANVFDALGQQTRTRERFKTAYLQRLADPTQPFDEDHNPYRTVDYLTIDLTVFNGSETNAPDGPNMEWIDEADADPFVAAPRFATRYKTGRSILDDFVSGGMENLSHGINTLPPEESVAALAGADTAHFPFPLFLNPLIDPDQGGDPNLDAPRTSHSSTLGYANASYGPRWRQVAGNTALSNYIGTPYQNWFTSVTWLNRPYVSAGELMWVPTTSSGRFGIHFGNTLTDDGAPAGTDLYAGTGPTAEVLRPEYQRKFPHLWNFFSGNANDFATSPNLWRILDWVKVPAPYDFESDFLSTNNDVLTHPLVGTNANFSAFGNRFDYSTFGMNPTGNPDSWDNGLTSGFWLNRWAVEAFRPPFNILDSPFREGRINLNTVKNPRVYRALMEGISHSADPVEGPWYTQFVESRRGFVAPAAADPETLGLTGADRIFSKDHAGQFAGAFRHSSVSDVAPLAGDRVDHPLGKTIMRQSGTISSLGTEPLFARSATNPAGSTNQTEWLARSVAHDQLPLTRLNNLASDQSNVFAVWITVGLFEVDGTTLSVGKEVGSDLGQVKRYRSFQIIDRSIPAQYDPGVLNNALDTVVVQRRLE